MASEAIELVIALAAKDAASSVIEGVGGKIKEFGKIGEAAALAAAALGTAVIAGIGAMAAMGVKAGEVGEEIRKLQIITGLTAESASELRYAGERLGISTEALDKSMGILAKNMIHPSKAIQDLNIEMVKNADGSINMGQSLSMVADKFKDMPDGPEKTAMALALFGRAGKDMIPLLNQGSEGLARNAEEAKKLGLVYNQDAVNASHAFTLAQKDLHEQFESMTQAVGLAVLPILTDLFGVMTNAAKTILPPVIEGFKMVAHWLGEVIKSVTGSQEFKSFVTFIRDEASAAFKIVGAAIQAFKTGDLSPMIDALTSGADTVSSSLVNMGQKAGEFAMSVINSAVNAVPRILEALLKWEEAFVGWVTNAIPKVSAALPKILDTILAFITRDGTKLLDGLVVWAHHFAAWVGPALVGLVENLTKLLGTMLSWLGDHAEDIGKTLVLWAGKFIEFVGTAVSGIVAKLPDILIAIARWVVTEGIPGVIRILFNLGKGMVEGIFNGLSGAHDVGAQAGNATAEGFIEGVAARGPDIYTAGQFIAETAAHAASEHADMATSTAVDIGSAMAQGMTSGFMESSGGLSQAMKDAVQNAMEDLTVAQHGLMQATQNAWQDAATAMQDQHGAATRALQDSNKKEIHDLADAQKAFAFNQAESQKGQSEALSDSQKKATQNLADKHAAESAAVAGSAADVIKALAATQQAETRALQDFQTNQTRNLQDQQRRQTEATNVAQAHAMQSLQDTTTAKIQALADSQKAATEAMAKNQRDQLQALADKQAADTRAAKDQSVEQIGTMAATASAAMKALKDSSLSIIQALAGFVTGAIGALNPNNPNNPVAAPPGAPPIGSPGGGAAGDKPIKGYTPGGVPYYQEGTNFVPRDGLAFLHQGEQVIPAGQSKGGTFIFNIGSVDSDARMRQVAREVSRIFSMEIALSGKVL